MLKIWLQDNVMTWSEKVMLHVSRFVSSAWTQLWCFRRSSLSIKSCSRKTVGDLSWPEMTLVAWGGVTGRNIPIQGDRSLGVAMTSIQSSEVRSRDVIWWLDIEWPVSEIFTTYAERMYEPVCKNSGSERRRFLDLRKTCGGVDPSPQHGAG